MSIAINLLSDVASGIMVVLMRRACIALSKEDPSISDITIPYVDYIVQGGNGSDIATSSIHCIGNERMAFTSSCKLPDIIVDCWWGICNYVVSMIFKNCACIILTLEDINPQWLDLQNFPLPRPLPS